MSGSAGGLAELERLLGDAPPAELGALDDAVLTELAGALREAQRRQARELRAAQETALRIVPWPLRGVARRTLGG